MLKGSERGCLILADISGYTGFLAGSELEHAQDVLRDLTQVVVGKLRPAFRLAKLEGDAAFCYSITDALDGALLLDTLEAAYFAFRRRLDAIKRATTCECNACVLIPALNLKFVAHHGEFVRERLFGTEELTGTDVIVAHRLLKNTVAERLDLAAYVFLTEACLAAAGMDPAAMPLLEHREKYADIGEVRGWVLNLQERWADEQARRRVRVTDRQAWARLEAHIPADPQAVWAFVTDPAKRSVFVSGVVGVDEATVDGRRGVGTRNHCVHGDGASFEEILDWRPFDYFTLLNIAPGLGSWTSTEEFRAADGGTDVTIRLQLPKSARDRAALEPLHDTLAGLYRAALDRVAEVFAEEAADRPTS